MPALAPPVADERSALREYLAFHQSSYFAVCYGLTDAQARSSPAASALSIGGLVKHVTRMQRSWMTWWRPRQRHRRKTPGRPTPLPANSPTNT